MKSTSFALALLFATVTAGYSQPSVAAGNTLNGASYAVGQAVAPGSLVSIFGTNLASTTAAYSTVPLSTTLAGTTVTMNGVAAPLFLVVHTTTNGDQVNAQIPYEATGSSSVQLVVSTSAGQSTPVTLPLAAAAPGIFTTNQMGTGQAVAYANSTGLYAAAAGSVPGATTQPIKTGDALIIYCTGLGAVTPPIADGDVGGSTLHSAVATPVVMVGGMTAQVLFAGVSPQFPGINQLNVQIPANAPTGNTVSLQIQVGSITTTDKVTIAVSN